MLCKALALSALLALATLPAQASSEEGSGVMEFVWQSVNLAILVGVLVYFARKPLLAFLADRRSQIKGNLEEAAGLLEAAEARYSEWQRKLIDLERETEAIRTEGIRHAEEDAALILADAQAAAERIHRGAEAAIEQELRRAQAELREEAANLATELAEQILKEQLAGSDRERLLDEFIVSVESSREAS
jgi:F-type H+-transporting ATPase subunit b